MVSSLPFRYGARCPALAMVVLPSAAICMATQVAYDWPRPHKPAVQCFQNHVRLVAGFHNGADGPDNQRHLHACLQAFACYVAQQNQNAAVSIRQDLEEVATHLLRGLVLGLKHVSRNRRNRFRNQQLLNLPCLVDFRLPLLAQTAATAGSASSAGS